MDKSIKKMAHYNGNNAPHRKPNGNIKPSQNNTLIAKSKSYNAPQNQCDIGKTAWSIKPSIRRIITTQVKYLMKNSRNKRSRPRRGYKNPKPFMYESHTNTSWRLNFDEIGRTKPWAEPTVLLFLCFRSSRWCGVCDAFVVHAL